jgi:hypothetical protein
MMFKALLLFAAVVGLSDPSLEEAICDRLSFQGFLGLSFSTRSGKIFIIRQISCTTS